MKRFIQIIFSLLFISATTLSCSEKVPEVDANTDNYYVKYEASSYRYYMQSVTANSDVGYFTVNNVTTYWEETFGPVSKGFKADISVGTSSTSTVKIYVSKNQEPFSLKATGSGGASYTIDF